MPEEQKPAEEQSITLPDTTEKQMAILGEEQDGAENEQQQTTQDEQAKLDKALWELSQIAGVPKSEALKTGLTEANPGTISSKEDIVSNKKQEPNTVISRTTLSPYMQDRTENTGSLLPSENKQSEKKSFWRSVKNFWEKTKKAIYVGWPKVLGTTREKVNAAQEMRRQRREQKILLKQQQTINQIPQSQ